MMVFLWLPYHVSATPEQVCAVAVTNETTDGFDVTLSALDAGLLAAGQFSCLVIG
jgi:hypothetical protein